MDNGGDFERVLKRQKFVSLEASATLDKILAGLSSAKDSVLSGSSSGDSLGKLRDFSTKVLESHKDFQSTLAKFTKNTDKKYFKSDLNAIWNPKALGDKTDALNRALAQHFIREGLFDLEQTFEDETGVAYLPEDFKNQFNGMFSIQSALRDGDCSLALNWAEEHSEALESRGSTLEFQLHRLKFIQMLVESRTQDCLAYARSKLSKFSKKHMADIQKLMCAILFAKRLKNSPYADFLDPHSATDVQSCFSRDFCALLGLSPSSPLLVSSTVGSTTLPVLMKMTSILKGQKALEWQSRGELPVEIPLLDNQRFHSVFTCPVSKEQSTMENPPMMLLCGHVICKEPLSRLAKGNPNAKFKCPYCPQDSTMAQCKRLYF